MYESPTASRRKDLAEPAEQPSRSLMVTAVLGVMVKDFRMSSSLGALLYVVSLVATSAR